MFEQLGFPHVAVFVLLLHLKLQKIFALSWVAVLVPLVLGQALSSIPAILLLARSEQATVVHAQFQRILARKTIYNSALRIVFLALVMARLDGRAPHMSVRLITVPVWLQLLVLLVMLHTSVKRLQDPVCTRAFKKQSAFIEVRLPSSRFATCRYTLCVCARACLVLDVWCRSHGRDVHTRICGHARM